MTNGSVVTPTLAPAGFTGSVIVNGAGSVNFTPAQSGNGVYFLNCCSEYEQRLLQIYRCDYRQYFQRQPRADFILFAVAL